jgi:hypothetical protein
VDVFVLGRKQTVPDEVRSLAEAKVARLARITPVLERAEVRITEGRDNAGVTRQVCEVTMTGHGHTVLVVDKLEHQVERLKGKLVGRSHPRHTRTIAGT